MLAESLDQRPNVEAELQRLKSLGGFAVTRGSFMRTAGVLSVSRAFGNLGLKAYVRAEPAITAMPLPAGRCTLVLASDGIFDVVSSREALETVRPCSKARRTPAKCLVDRAQGKCRRASPPSPRMLPPQLSPAEFRAALWLRQGKPQGRELRQLHSCCCAG